MSFLKEEYNVKIIRYPASGEIEYRFYRNSIKVDFPVSVPDPEIYPTFEDAFSLDINPDLIPLIDTLRSSDSVNRYTTLSDEQLLYKKERSINSSISRTKNKIYDYCRANKWDYFLTLTLDPSKVDRYNFEDCVKKVSKWIENFKKRKSSSFKYIGVPEKHKDGAYHFHFLCSGVPENLLSFSGKYTKGKDKKEIYNLDSYGLGWSTLVKVGSSVLDNAKVSNYITKYITKELILDTPNKKRYWCSRNLDKGLEDTLLLGKEDFKLLKEEIQKKTVYGKTVEVETANYGNTISYCLVHL